MVSSTNAKPTVVWVPGLLHTPEHFQPIISALAKVSIPSVSFSLPNVGAGAPTAAPYDDLKQLRAMLEGLVDEGKEVLLICHSYGEYQLPKPFEVFKGLSEKEMANQVELYGSSSWLLLPSQKVNQHGHSPKVDSHLNGPHEMLVEPSFMPNLCAS